MSWLKLKPRPTKIPKPNKGWRSEDRRYKFNRSDSPRHSTVPRKADPSLRPAPAKVRRERKSARLRSG
jgi:hypothetical protein